MATAAMTPPPGGQPPDSGDPQNANPPGAPSTPGAAPAPPQPSEGEGLTRAMITALQTFRAIARQVPKAAPHIAQMMDQVPHVMAAIQAQAQPGSPAAPPMGS
jgi:hypothetical protein